MFFVTASLCSNLLFAGVFGFVSADKKIIRAESGQDVTLTCRAPNNNIISVEWSKADLGDEYVLVYRGEQFVPDKQHPSFKNRVDLQDRQMKDGDVSLILKDVTINDTGTYECRVFMREKRIWQLINLHVVPPGPKTITAESGQDVTLTCRAPNNNITAVKWIRADLGDENVLLYRDSHFVPANQHPSFKNRVDLQDKQMKDGDVSLILNNVNTADTGTYKCHVLMRETRSWKNSIIYLTVFDPPDQKTITSESGQDVTLTCRAPNNNIIVLKWSRADLGDEYLLLYRNGQYDPTNQHPSFKERVDLQDRQMKDGDVSLILKDVTINDAGTYKCLYTNNGPLWKLSIIDVYVDPPGQTGGHKEDGGKEDGSVVLIVGLSVSAVLLLLVAAVVGFLIYRRWKLNPADPHVAEHLQHLQPDYEIITAESGQDVTLTCRAVNNESEKMNQQLHQPEC
ncbi:CD226 antigen-like [Pelmatolapia mariae]|uniref:CD226 antigen-like n=1 Tax=Pelmatolapia mariae TaxID=158779 RepID=UPI002FE618C6